MASIYQSADAFPSRPAPNASIGADLLSVRAVLPLTVALVINDVLEVLKLPAGHVPVDAIAESDDLDTGGPTITLHAGLISGVPGTADAARTVGQEILTSSTIGQAGGIARSANVGLLKVAAVDYDRSVGFLVAVAPTTGVAGLGTMNVNRGFWQPGTTYTANDYITLPDGRRVKCTTGGVSAAGVAGQPFPLGLPAMVKGGTLADGTVTWTMSDAFVALTLHYRAARYGV